MVPLYVACIVEGQGDVSAAPVLLKRLVTFVNPDIYADVRPFRVGRSKLVLLGELERAVELAGRGLRSPGIVLIVIDSDDDCPKELAQVLLDRARRAAGDRWPVGVVLAKREFENWFIAVAESIAGYAGLRPDLTAPPNPESIRGAKEWLHRNMLSDRKERVRELVHSCGRIDCGLCWPAARLDRPTESRVDPRCERVVAQKHAFWQSILADHRPACAGEQVRSQCRPASAVLRQDVSRDRAFLFSRDYGLKWNKP